MPINRMTKFRCKELLYDYASGSLDSLRRQQVKEFLAEQDDLQEELKRLQEAIKYTGSLKKITISQPYHQVLLQEFEGEGSLYYIKKAGVNLAKYGALAATCVLLIMYFPSEKVMQYFQRNPDEVVLAEVKTTDELSQIPTAMHEDSDLVQDVVEAIDPTFDDSEQVSNAKVLARDAEKEEEVDLKAKLAEQEEELKKAAEAEAKEPVEPVVEKKKDPAHAGILFRAFLKMDNYNVVADAIEEKLRELGAEKGGSVPIGWEKPNGNRYFHFKISDANFEVFKTYLNTIKQIKIESYAHPRAMPEGTKRMILEVQK
tara:strand:+ start:10340 stop:11284 length:945 start_codon:yes stop_codon:yes gene_type:complete